MEKNLKRMKAIYIDLKQYLVIFYKKFESRLLCKNEIMLLIFFDYNRLF